MFVPNRLKASAQALVSRIYKGPGQINTEKAANQEKKWIEDINRHFMRVSNMYSKHMKVA